MPKPLRVLVWVLVFAGAAGAGAVVASRSDPFPPGVQDPGARPTAPVTPSPVTPSWDLRMTSDTKHALHVGGACATDWHVAGAVTAQSDGTVSGNAVAKLAGPAECDFAQSQVQTKAINLLVTGKQAGGSVALSFSEAGRSPVGSHDLGGFTNTLSGIHPRFASGSTRPADVRVRVQKPDGDLGSYTSYNQVQLRPQ